MRDPTTTDSTVYGYDGSSRLNAITDRKGHTTTYGYDAAWKVAQITAPAVPVDAGGGSTTMQQPVTGMQSWQAVGVPTTATGSAPAALVRRDSIVAREGPQGQVLRRALILSYPACRAQRTRSRAASTLAEHTSSQLGAAPSARDATPCETSGSTSVSPSTSTARACAELLVTSRKSTTHGARSCIC
jgi:YD repeat-containing protein